MNGDKNEMEELQEDVGIIGVWVITIICAVCIGLLYWEPWL